MPPRIRLHSQCLWVWQFAAGASTAGFLEKVAADLERELRTLRYPAMSSGPNHFAVDTRWNSEQRGGQALLDSPHYTELQQHRPSSLPGGTRWCYVRVATTQRRDWRLYERGLQGWRISLPFFCLVVLEFSAKLALTNWGIIFGSDNSSIQVPLAYFDVARDQSKGYCQNCCRCCKLKHHSRRCHILLLCQWICYIRFQRDLQLQQDNTYSNKGHVGTVCALTNVTWGQRHVLQIVRKDEKADTRTNQASKNFKLFIIRSAEVHWVLLLIDTTWKFLVSGTPYDVNTLKQCRFCEVQHSTDVSEQDGSGFESQPGPSYIQVARFLCVWLLSMYSAVQRLEG